MKGASVGGMRQLAQAKVGGELNRSCDKRVDYEGNRPNLRIIFRGNDDFGKCLNVVVSASKLSFISFKASRKTSAVHACWLKC